MPLNDIHLSSIHLFEMYQNSLVEITEGSSHAATPGPPASPTGPSEWPYLGQYKKNILLIVRYDDLAYLPDAHLNFVTSVLGACKSGLADAAVLNLSNAPSVEYKKWQEKFNPRVCILFGLTPQQVEMPVHFPQFQVQPFNNCSFLCTPGIEELESDKVLKSKLWVCLRKIFGV